MQTKSKAFAAAGIAAALLSACMGAATSPDALPPAPSVAEVARVADISFSNTRSFPPVAVEVTKVSYSDFLGPSMYDYYACLTATEEAQWQTFQNGQVIRDVGDLYDVQYVMQLRQYDYGWGSGVMRQVNSQSKIGLASTRDLCP